MRTIADFKHDIEFEVEVPKLYTVNHMYINSGKRRFRSKDCQNYQALLALEAGKHAYKVTDKKYTAECGVNLEIHTKGRRWDVDNITKPIFDAFEGILYQNDKQIIVFMVTVKKHKKKQNIIKVGVSYDA